MLKPYQCRAARGLLDWTQAELARAAGVAEVTVRAFEKERTGGRGDTISALETALESAGVELIPLGVRFRQ